MRALSTTTTLTIVLLLTACATTAPGTAPPASENGAVLDLLDTAKSEMAQGRFEPAGASLERALRIEPQNAVLWAELAQVRLQQGQMEQAANLATKSNALAGANRALRAQNWRLIAQVRMQRGDSAGAEDALRKAAVNEE